MKNEVLKDINIEIKPQEVVVVIGPSGSGKSTFLRCLNLLETITAGHVYIEGTDISAKRLTLMIFAKRLEWYSSNLIYSLIKQY